MNKICVRLVSLLLVTCLITDPAVCSPLTTFAPVSPTVSPTLLTEQAFAPLANVFSYNPFAAKSAVRTSKYSSTFYTAVQSLKRRGPAFLLAELTLMMSAVPAFAQQKVNSPPPAPPTPAVPDNLKPTPDMTQDELNAKAAAIIKTMATSGWLRAILEQASSRYYEGRAFGTKKGDEYAKNVLIPLLQGFGLDEVTTQPVGIKPGVDWTFGGRDSITVFTPARGVNVIGVIKGTDRRLKTERIMLSAHYDAVHPTRNLGQLMTIVSLLMGGPVGFIASQMWNRDLMVDMMTFHEDFPGRKSIFPGADDNGSGTGSVLAAAMVLSAMKKAGFQFKRTIEFDFFTGEEEGLNGSLTRVHNMSGEEYNDLMAVINFDMVGKNPPQFPDEVYFFQPVTTSLRAEVLTYFIAYMFGRTIPMLKILPDQLDAANRVLALDLHLNFMAKGDNASDHAAFIRKRKDGTYVGSTTLFDGSLPLHEYHNGRDTAKNMHFNYHARVTQLVILTAWWLANVDQIEEPRLPPRHQKPDQKLSKEDKAVEGNFYDIEDRDDGLQPFLAWLLKVHIPGLIKHLKEDSDFQYTTQTEQSVVKKTQANRAKMTKEVIQDRESWLSKTEHDLSISYKSLENHLRKTQDSFKKIGYLQRGIADLQATIDSQRAQLKDPLIVKRETATSENGAQGTDPTLGKGLRDPAKVEETIKGFEGIQSRMKEELARLSDKYKDILAALSAMHDAPLARPGLSLTLLSPVSSIGNPDFDQEAELADLSLGFKALQAAIKQSEKAKASPGKLEYFMQMVENVKAAIVFLQKERNDPQFDAKGRNKLDSFISDYSELQRNLEREVAKIEKELKRNPPPPAPPKDPDDDGGSSLVGRRMLKNDVPPEPRFEIRGLLSHLPYRPASLNSFLLPVGLLSGLISPYISLILTAITLASIMWPLVKKLTANSPAQDPSLLSAA